jgi:hypothetical protein
LELKKSSFVRGILWSSDHNFKVTRVVLLWLSIDTYNWVCGKFLCFFENTGIDCCAVGHFLLLKIELLKLVRIFGKLFFNYHKFYDLCNENKDKK